VAYLFFYAAPRTDYNEAVKVCVWILGINALLFNFAEWTRKQASQLHSIWIFPFLPITIIYFLFNSIFGILNFMISGIPQIICMYMIIDNSPKERALYD
jgi:hypothetical protein